MVRTVQEVSGGGRDSYPIMSEEAVEHSLSLSGLSDVGV